MIRNVVAFFVSMYVGSLVLSEMVNFHEELDLIGWTTDEPEEQPHKQTYLEYVHERLEVERLLR